MTSSTDESRSARSAPRGTSNGTFASASVRLARTMRCAIVGSGKRKARGISGVVRPPSKRSVSATRASVERTGWQAVNTRRNRSSPTSSSSFASISGVSRSSSSSCPSASTFWASLVFRRSASIARCLATTISQPPGLSGTPDSGHCDSAATSASCASSSAVPTSRTMRASRAISRGDSIRQSASMARCTSLTPGELSHYLPHLDHPAFPARKRDPNAARLERSAREQRAVPARARASS